MGGMLSFYSHATQQPVADIMSAIDGWWRLVDATPATTIATASKSATMPTPSNPDNTASMADLAARVASATRNMPSSNRPVAIEDALSRMKAASKIRPRTAADVDKKSPEYAFGKAFTDMVRHIVAGYLNEAVVPIIRNTIIAELEGLAGSAG